MKASPTLVRSLSLRSRIRPTRSSSPTNIPQATPRESEADRQLTRRVAEAARLAQCHRPAKEPPTVAAPLVRCLDLAMFDGHPLALPGWLEADQAELTVLHRPEAEGALKATAHRFCASRHSLEPTGAFALVPA